MSSATLCSVFVPSCDPYADLWPPFFTLLQRHWPDCPFPIYLGANSRAYDDPRVTTLSAPADIDWSERLDRQLAELPTPYVLLVLEDFFWRARTPTGEVLALLDTLHALNGGMLRLTNRPPPDETVPGHPAIGRIRAGAPYRASTQAAIWRVTTLRELLRPGETIWEFEVAGSRRSDREADGFYSTWRQVLPYAYHVVQQGKWFPHEARRFARMGIGCDFTARPIMSRREALGARVEWTKSWLLHRFPWPVRLRLQALANRLGI